METMVSIFLTDRFQNRPMKTKPLFHYFHLGPGMGKDGSGWVGMGRDGSGWVGRDGSDGMCRSMGRLVGMGRSIGRSMDRSIGRSMVR